MRKVPLLLSLSLLGIAALSAQSITVTSPGAGVTWNRGSVYTIQWRTAAEPVPRPLIDIYMLQGGRWVRDITRGAPDSGAFSWRVPADAPLGTFTIQVTWVGTSVSGYSQAFTIAAGSAAASLQLLLPNGGENWQVDTWQLVQWSFTLAPPITASSQVRLVLYQNNSRLGAITQGTSIGANGRGSFNWKVGLLENGTAVPGTGFKIRIELIGGALADESDMPFTIGSSGQPAGPFDLEPTDLYFENNEFKFKVRNNGDPFSGDFSATRLFSGPEVTATRMLVTRTAISRGEEKIYSFGHTSWPAGACGIGGRLTIDPGPAETNKANNTINRMLWKWPYALSHIEFPVRAGAGAQVLANKDGDIKLREGNLMYHIRSKDCHNEQITKVEFPVSVTVRNCGGQPSRNLDLVIYVQSACPSPGFYVGSRQAGIVLQPGESRVITMNVKIDFFYLAHAVPWMSMKIVLFDGDTPGKNAFFTSLHGVMLDAPWAQ